MKHRLNPCKECGKADKLRYSKTCISCQRCGRYVVTTDDRYLAFTWEKHNLHLLTTQHTQEHYIEGMKELIERVQNDLDNNWPVEKEDIQALIYYIEMEIADTEADSK